MTSKEIANYIVNSTLEHHGVKGQKWGIRKAYNKFKKWYNSPVKVDRKKYNLNNAYDQLRYAKKLKTTNGDRLKTGLGIGLAAGGVGLMGSAFVPMSGLFGNAGAIFGGYGTAVGGILGTQKNHTKRARNTEAFIESDKTGKFNLAKKLIRRQRYVG